MGLAAPVYEAAFYSNYLGGRYAAEKLGLYETGAIMLSQAEKLQAKFSVGREVQGIKLLKLSYVYQYSGGSELIRNKIREIDAKY